MLASQTLFITSLFPTDMQYTPVYMHHDIFTDLTDNKARVTD